MSSDSNLNENPGRVNTTTSLVLANEEVSSRRHPENLQGVLRYSIQAAGTQNAVSESVPTLQPLDEERRTFLENTLRSLVVDPLDKIKECLNVLLQKGPEESTHEAHEAALEQISELVDNIDVAMDFHKIGGFAVLAPCLASPHPTVRSRAAHLIGDLAQNNPYIQKNILETDLMRILLKLLLEDQSECGPDENDNPDVKTSCLFALSCLIRGNDDGIQKFKECNGWPVVLHVLGSHGGCPHFRLSMKAAFLVTSICSYKPEVIDELIEHHFVVQLRSLLDTSRPELLEYVVQAMLTMVNGSNRVTEMCADKELKLEPTLVKIMEGNDPETDVYLFSKELKYKVFEQYQVTVK